MRHEKKKKKKKKKKERIFKEFLILVSQNLINFHKKVVNFGSLPRTWLISPAVKMFLVGRQTVLSHRSAC
jgi:hypothetical protein